MLRLFYDPSYDPAADALRRMVNLRRIGGLWHWRVGNVGGSFYRRRNPLAARLAALR